MNSILLYIEPEENEHQQMIQMAADLVEALTFQLKDLQFLFPSIGVVAEPFACLEIGLSMLGRGETGTIEGGEGRASTLLLFPYVSEMSRESGEISLIESRDTDFDRFGTLEDLALFGAIELDPELSLEGQTARSASEVLERILLVPSWQTVVVFALGQEFEQIQLRTQTKARIVYVRDLEVDQRRIPALLERLEPVEGEVGKEIQRQSVIQALKLEALFVQLEIRD